MLLNIRILAVSLAIGIVTHAEEWPGFRGPTGQGISNEKNLPTTWSKTENIAWSSAIPGEGWSSPIVWGDRVYLTTATEGGASCRVVAVSRADGKILWNEEVARQKTLRKEGKNSYATPTPVTDGKRIYAVFNDGTIVAVNLDGKVDWTNREVRYYSQHGLGGSPILQGDALIMPFDGSSDGADKTVGWQTPWDQAQILALDKDTGKVLWRAKRGPSRIAHTTPIVVKLGDDEELVSSAGDVIQGFSLKDGARLWSVKAEGEGVVPSPISGDGLVFTASGFGNPMLRAVRLESNTDDGKREVVWSEKKQVPAMPSPIFFDHHLYLVTEKGTASCLDAATGKILWEERLGGSFSASPVYADGHIYFLSEEGDCTVVEAKPKFAKVARNSLKEPCQASMALSRGQIFIRSKERLYCVGKK